MKRKTQSYALLLHIVVINNRNELVKNIELNVNIRKHSYGTV